MTASQIDSLPDDVRQVLLRRAERLRATVDTTDEGQVMWVGVFTLGEELFAFPLRELRGVMPLRLVTPVPLAPPVVVGIARFQGQIVTVLSLASLLGGRAWRADPATSLVLEFARGLVAFDCGEVPRAVGVPLALVQQAREAAPGALSVPITREDGQSLQLVELSSLFVSEED